VAIGVAIFIVIYFIPIRRLTWLIPLIYWINIILLVMVDLFGVSILGAQRWLRIPFTHFTIQPSEFMKTTLLLMLGYLIYKNPPNPVYKLKDFLKLSFYIILPFLLIAKEPDLGTALITLIVGYGVLFIVGVDRKIWISIVIFLIFFIPFAYEYLLKDYQRKRIENFLNKPSYHIKQSLIAIGSGGMYGKRKEDATQTRFKFLPIASSDFIFAYLVERFGFVGGASVIGLYFILISYLLLKAQKLKRDYLARVILSGVGIMIFVYVFVNIAMTMNLAPVVGVPLPLISHGGTSFINFMILFAIVENLTSKKEFLHTYGIK